MNIAEARSYDDGIEYYVNNKNISIRVTRNSKGEIVLTKQNIANRFKKVKESWLVKLAMIVVSILFAFIYNYISNFKIEVIAIVALFWITTFLYYFINSKNPKKFMSFRYHAAEHKALNYIDKYGKATQDCYEIMKMPSISIRCGSTVIAIVYVLFSLIIIGVLFIPGIILKILWCAFSLFITLYLWANGKCDFFQKLVLKNPGYEEVELATYGLCEYMKMKE